MIRDIIIAISKHNAIAMSCGGVEALVQIGCIEHLTHIVGRQTKIGRNNAKRDYIQYCKEHNVRMFYEPELPGEEEPKTIGTQASLEINYPQPDLSKLPSADDTLFKCAHCGSKMEVDEHSGWLTCTNHECKGV